MPSLTISSCGEMPIKNLDHEEFKGEIMKFYNPTKKILEFKYNSRIQVLNPGAYLKTHSEEMVTHCLRDFCHLGLVCLYDGDSLEEKKQQGLKRYYDSL